TLSCTISRHLPALPSFPTRRSSDLTLADANDAHDWRIYADFAQTLIGIARPLYASDPIGVELDQSLYALDSTTIDLCLSLFPWRSEEHTSELQSRFDLVCRLLLEKK